MESSREKLIKIMLPATNNKLTLLILDAFAAHYTALVTEKFEANKIEHHVIPGGYTSELKSLDVCVNKSLKDRFKQYRQSWFADKNSLVMTDGGYRQKPTYDVVMG